MSPGQYLRFLAVGTLVGSVTVGCRELVAYLLPADTALYYSISVVAAYAVGILLGFLLNREFTFRRRSGRGQWTMLPRFAAIALLGLGTTWALSLALRYGLELDRILGSRADAVAFIAAALLASLVTYPLTARFVFAGTAETRATASGVVPSKRQQQIAGHPAQTQ